MPTPDPWGYPRTIAPRPHVPRPTKFAIRQTCVNLLMTLPKTARKGVDNVGNGAHIGVSPDYPGGRDEVGQQSNLEPAFSAPLPTQVSGAFRCEWAPWNGHGATLA